MTKCSYTITTPSMDVVMLIQWYLIPSRAYSLFPYGNKLYRYKNIYCGITASTLGGGVVLINYNFKVKAVHLLCVHKVWAYSRSDSASLEVIGKTHSDMSGGSL